MRGQGAPRSRFGLGSGSVRLRVAVFKVSLCFGIGVPGFTWLAAPVLKFLALGMRGDTALQFRD